MPYPAAFKYTKEHEWIKADDGNATIGITHYAQESLGDIVFVDLPKPGADNGTSKRRRDERSRLRLDVELETELLLDLEDPAEGMASRGVLPFLAHGNARFHAA